MNHGWGMSQDVTTAVPQKMAAALRPLFEAFSERGRKGRNHAIAPPQRRRSRMRRLTRARSKGHRT